MMKKSPRKEWSSSTVGSSDGDFIVLIVRLLLFFGKSGVLASRECAVFSTVWIPKTARSFWMRTQIFSIAHLPSANEIMVS